MPRKITSKEERATLCAEWRASRLSRKAFCEQKKIKIGALYRWLRKGKQNKQSGHGKTLNFIALNKSKPLAPSYLEVSLPNGIMLKMTLQSNNVINLIKELL